MTLKDDLFDIKMDIAMKYYKPYCTVCLKKFTRRRNPTFHHKKYLENDVIYSDYDKGTRGSIQYHKDLLKEIRKNPKRFSCVCAKCHQVITRLLYYKKDKLTRILRIVRESR